MAEESTEEELLRSVALQNARSILLARERAERELVAAREELRQVANRLKLALDAGHLGDWTWETATDELVLGPRAAELFGLPPDIPHTRAAMRELLHPEDSDRARVALDHALETRGDYDVEYRLKRLVDGRPAWVAAKGRGV